MKTYKKLLVAALLVSGGSMFAPVADNPPENFLKGVGQVATLGLVDFNDCDHNNPKKCTRHCHTKECHRRHPDRPYNGDGDSKPAKKSKKSKKSHDDDDDR